MQKKPVKLHLYSHSDYSPIDNHDPMRFHYVPGYKDLYRERLIRCLGECRGGQRILEVGFGSGLTFANLSELYKEIFGIEKNNPVNISKIQKQFERKQIYVHLTCGDLLNLPYPDGEFDTVLIISVLEHLYPEQQAQAFKELHRVIKPKGQLVYGVPIERPMMTFFYRLLGYKIRNFHFSDQDTIRRNAGKRFASLDYENVQVFGLKPLSVYQVVNCQK